MKIPVPFMPKFVKVTTKFKVYWVGLDSFIEDVEVYSTGISFSKCFYLNFRSYIQKTGKNEFTLKEQFQINFISKSILESTIRSNCIKEANDQIAL